MIELTHPGPEPADLTRFRRQMPQPDWMADEVIAAKDAIRQQLNLEQDGLCVYCEDLLGMNEGHIEHICPRNGIHGALPLAFVYSNLAHSCTTGHCGHKKGHQPLPIEPRLGCNVNFILSTLDGTLSPDVSRPPSDQHLAAETLRVLGLNDDAGLMRRRWNEATTLLGLSNPQDQADYIASAPFRFSLQRII